MSESTHPLPCYNSCVNLIFTDQLNLVVNCGTNFSLNLKRNHQITHRKFDLNIEYLHPYERLVWGYKKAHTGNIKKLIESVDWELL